MEGDLLERSAVKRAATNHPSINTAQNHPRQAETHDSHVESTRVPLVERSSDVAELLEVQGPDLARGGFFGHLEPCGYTVDGNDFLGSLQKRPSDAEHGMRSLSSGRPIRHEK